MTDYLETVTGRGNSSFVYVRRGHADVIAGVSINLKQLSYVRPFNVPLLRYFLFVAVVYDEDGGRSGEGAPCRA